jgi:hypothetical protein
MLVVSVGFPLLLLYYKLAFVSREIAPCGKDADAFFADHPEHATLIQMYLRPGVVLILPGPRLV